MLCWLMARQDGEPLAHIINLCYEKELFYWQGGSFRSGLRYRPNDALIWHTIRWGSTQGFSVYNLGTSPTPGVAKFKAGWGAITLSYQAYHRDCRLLNFLRSFRRI
jgi:lipid II:glycine glycyltransferase (peptidoglycan interpeptide bridge formation enzyme)